jgi:hypothetical protein
MIAVTDAALIAPAAPMIAAMTPLSTGFSHSCLNSSRVEDCSDGHREFGLQWGINSHPL